MVQQAQLLMQDIKSENVAASFNTTYSFIHPRSDAFARKQQAVGVFFDLEKAYETTWQYGIIRESRPT